MHKWNNLVLIWELIYQEDDREVKISRRGLEEAKKIRKKLTVFNKRQVQQHLVHNMETIL